MIYGQGINTQRYTYGLDVLSLDTWNKSLCTWNQNCTKAITAKKADRSYYLQDELGSPIRIIGEAGNTKARYSYDAFGRPIIPVNLISRCKTKGNIYSYTGYQYDLSTGLMYAQARYYMPEVGRFISVDAYKGTVTDPQSLNLYVYCGNNPVNFVDPSGYIGEYTLTIYSSPNTGLIGGHSFIVFKNNTESMITIGAFNLDAGASVSIGTWGNQEGHLGIWYNVEAMNPSSFKSDVSLQMDLDNSELKTVNNFISKHDNWSLYRNCSYFASSVWNSVSSTKLSSLNIIGWNTPAGLSNSIMRVKEYNTGQEFAQATQIGYLQNGKYYTPPTNSFRFINSVSSSHSSSGYSSSGCYGPSSSGSGYRSSSLGAPRIK